MKQTKFFGAFGMAAILAVLTVFTGCKKEEDATISSITISSDAETIKVGATVTLSYTYEPTDAIVESAVWSSSAETVATVDQEGVVTGISEGVATITITVNDKFTAICAVTVEATPIYTEGSYSGKGIKIGDTWWAPVNCGYDNTHTYGLLYQWGRKYGQAYENGSITPETMTMEQGEESANSDKFGLYNSNDYNWFSAGVDNTLWNGSSKGTYDPCPSGWRLPTKKELNALYGGNTSGWTTDVNGQNGFYFNGTNSCTSSTEGDKIFLPAAGYRDYNDGSVRDRNDNGYYWSSELIMGKATCLCIYSSGRVEVSSGSLAGGRSVRCVKE